MPPLPESLPNRRSCSLSGKIGRRALQIDHDAVPKMTLESVLSLIEQARRQEANRGCFRQQMADKLQELHLVIGINNPDPSSCLVSFVEEYIEMAPRLVECVAKSAEQVNRQALFAPFLEAAVKSFERPSAMLARYDGLDGLLIKAYMCHRLIEEMYENNRSIRNANLIDTQTTEANLLAHHLIGEPFANELDSSILVRVRELMSSPSYYDLDLGAFAEEIRQTSGVWMRDCWKKLLIRNHITFKFSYRDPLQ